MSKCFLILIASRYFFMRLWFWAGFPPHLPSYWSFAPLYNIRKPQKAVYTNVCISDWILLPLLLFDISEHSKIKLYRKSLKTAHLHFCNTLYYCCNLDLSRIGILLYYPYVTCQSPWKTTFTNKKPHSKWAIKRLRAKEKKILQYLYNDLC